MLHFIFHYFWAQMNTSAFRLLPVVLLSILAGCAQITSPTGGKRDLTPPKLVKVTPVDSLKNTRIKKIELYFNKYITVADVAKEVQISPILTIQPTVTGLYKKVTVKIADTLLEDNTTYRISFGKSIKDIREGNIFANYTYVFSTGSYFDSLLLQGKVINASTGLADSSGVSVVLYNATENDSAIVRHKPRYIVKTDAAGAFIFKGLPKRKFKIYALKDGNENLTYDGADEMIAFNDNPVESGDTTAPQVLLRLFREPPDTSIKAATADTKPATGSLRQKNAKEEISYSVNIDTSNATRRTFDITGKIEVSFSNTPILNRNKITMSCDSNGQSFPINIAFSTDTLHPKMLYLSTNWLENTQYTLKLAKGFDKDTAGNDIMPSKYVFRTKQDDDYGKVNIRFPGKYRGAEYLLMIVADNDTIYQKPISDTVVSLNRLRPAKYTFRIIVDKNRNGKWDTGNLFGKKQPEEVIPYTEVLNLRAGWENDIDFEPQKVATGAAR